MRNLATVVCLLGAVGGLVWFVLALASAHSAAYDIEAMIGVLIAVCGFGFAGVIDALPQKPKNA